MKLVKNANQAWRWFSVQAMVIALAVQGAWAALTPQQIAGLPDWVSNAVTIVILIFGIIGRLIDQGSDNE